MGISEKQGCRSLVVCCDLFTLICQDQVQRSTRKLQDLFVLLRFCCECTTHDMNFKGRRCQVIFPFVLKMILLYSSEGRSFLILSVLVTPTEKQPFVY